MFVYLSITLIIVATVYSSSLPKDCGQPSNENLVEWRIIGGNDAAVGEFPWFSLLTYAIEDKLHPQSNNFCGSSIINERWILTAAHCLPLPSMAKQDLKVRLGVHNMSLHEKSEVDVYIEKIKPHERYNPSLIVNDIALLKMNESLDFKKHKHLRPICLATNETKLTNKCVTYGFGLTNATHLERPKNGILKKLDTTVADPAHCKKNEGKIFNEFTEICIIADSKGGHSVCDADSGGPIQCLGDDHRWYQVGVVSYGGECGAPNNTDVYTKVSAYLNWIEKTIENN